MGREKFFSWELWEGGGWEGIPELLFIENPNLRQCKSRTTPLVFDNSLTDPTPKVRHMRKTPWMTASTGSDELVVSVWVSN